MKWVLIYAINVDGASSELVEYVTPSNLCVQIPMVNY